MSLGVLSPFFIFGERGAKYKILFCILSDQSQKVFISKIMITKQKKQEIVAELTNKFQKQKSVIFTDFRGVSVNKLMAIRRAIKKTGAEFKVARKTFLRLALKKIGVEYDPKELDGEIGVIFSYDDSVTPVKTAVSFRKENPTFKLLKGILNGKLITAEEATALAKLPSREQLLGKLVFALNAPIQGFHNVLQANIKKLVVVINKVKESRT